MFDMFIKEEAAVGPKEQASQYTPTPLDAGGSFYPAGRAQLRSVNDNHYHLWFSTELVWNLFRPPVQSTESLPMSKADKALSERLKTLYVDS